MRQIKTYIATFLMLVFAFPIAFQAVHVALAHQHDRGSHCDHQCDRTAGDITDHGQSKPDRVQGSDEPCAICEYEFAVFQAPEALDIPINTAVSSAEFLSAYISRIVPFSVHALALRGPPTCLQVGLSQLY